MAETYFVEACCEEKECKESVTYMDNKGFAYCEKHKPTPTYTCVQNNCQDTVTYMDHKGYPYCTKHGENFKLNGRLHVHKLAYWRKKGLLK